MTTYTVHAPPDAPDASERFAFVKDGIAWPALFVPVLWVLWRKLWLALLWYIVFVLVVAWIGRLAGETVAFIVGVLGSILFALEANNIRRLSLRRRGWRELGTSFGDDLEEAEVRFFHARNHAPLQTRPERREALARAAFLPTRADDADEPILGLFPEPDR